MYHLEDENIIKQVIPPVSLNYDYTVVKKHTDINMYILLFLKYITSIIRHVFNML